MGWGSLFPIKRALPLYAGPRVWPFALRSNRTDFDLNPRARLISFMIHLKLRAKAPRLKVGSWCDNFFLIFVSFQAYFNFGTSYQIRISLGALYQWTDDGWMETEQIVKQTETLWENMLGLIAFLNGSLSKRQMASIDRKSAADAVNGLKIN